MTNQNEEFKLDRPLKPGEILLFSEENFGGKEWLITSDTSSFDLNLIAASLQIGPRTGVTLFTQEDYGGLSQDLSTDLASFTGSKLQDQKPKSLKIWSTSGRQFRGYWAIEVDKGLYLSVPDPNGAGVVTTSPTVSESEQFRITDANVIGPVRGAAAPEARGASFEKPDVPIQPPPLTINDLQKFTMVDESDAGFRKFSLRAEDNQWILYDSVGHYFLASGEKEARKIFGRAIKIAKDETQVGELIQGEVALYEKNAYWGKAWVFHTDYADFDRIVNLNDEVSSIQLGPLTGATVYRGVQFTEDEPVVGKQDIVFNLSSLEDEQVGENQISSIRIWRIAAPGSLGVTFTCCLSQDFRFAEGTLEEYSAYRTTLRLPLAVQTVEVWATDETIIEVDGIKYPVDEDQSQQLQPNPMRCLVITTDAMVSPGDEERSGSLRAPGLKLKIHYNTMQPQPDERIVIYPDQEVHTRLANLKDDDALWNATYADNLFVIKDRSERKRTDVANAQKMISKVMSTVRYTPVASGGWEQTISPERLDGKNWALDFTYKVTADSLYVRKGPGKKFKPEGLLRKDDFVEVLDFNEDSSWIYIRRIPDGLKGWCSSIYLDKITKPPTGDRYRVTAKGLHVREGPGVEYRTLGYIACDDTVTAIGVNDSGNWRQIVRDDGLTGWASARYLSLAQPQPPQSFPQAPGMLVETGPASGVSSLAVEARFHEISEEVVLALLAAAEYPDTDLARGWDFFDKVSQAIKNGVSLVVTQVKKGVAVIIKLTDQVIAWIVDTAEKVVAFVEGIFEKIGAAIEEVVKWLRFVFDWNDILQTQEYLRDMILQLFGEIGKFAERARDPVTTFFNNKGKDFLIDELDKAIEALGGTTGSNATEPGFVSNILASLISNPLVNQVTDAVLWLLSKIMSIGVGGGILAFELVGTHDSNDYTAKDTEGDLDGFLNETLVHGLENIIKIPEGLVEVFATLLANPDKPLLAVAELLKLFRDQLVGLIDAGREITLSFLQLVAKLFKQINNLLTSEIRIPFISYLLNFIDVEMPSFSLLDAITLFLAVPTAVISKVFSVKAPASDVPSFAPPAPKNNVNLINELGLACSLIEGITGSILDMTVETDKLKERAASGADQVVAKELPFTDFLEFLSFISAFGGCISSWYEFIFPESDGETPSTGQRIMDVILFGFESILVALDLLTMIVEKRNTRKRERFKRSTQETAVIASGLGALHILILVIRNVVIEKYLDILWDVLKTLQEVGSFLRLPQYMKYPQVIVTIATFNSLKTGVPLIAHSLEGE